MPLSRRSLVAVVGLLVSIFVVGLCGCTALKTFPQAARAGDTITLAVGSADGMSRANTTANFVSDAEPGVDYDLTGGIRSIFRLYADKASSLYASGSTPRFIVDTSGHEPWITVMVVDLPQGLPTGSGKVNVTTTATYPTIGSHINDKPIDLEILPGVGAAADLTYEFGLGSTMLGDLGLLEAQPHAQVMPMFPQAQAWPLYGAIEIKLQVPTSVGTAVRVVTDDMRVATSSNLNVITRRDSNGDLTVIFVNHTGKLRYYEPRFSIVLIDNPDQQNIFLATPTITSVSYFDIDGNTVSGPLGSSFLVQMR